MKQRLFLSVVALMAAMAASAAKVTVNVQTEGTLEEVLDAQSVTNITELTITGRLTAQDIVYLRAGEGRVANLEVLDIKDVTLVASDMAYATTYRETYYLSDEEYVTSRIVDPSGSWVEGDEYTVYSYYGMTLAGAFNGMLLTKVVMPSSLKKIGRRCFLGCKILESVVVPEGLTAIDASAFNGVTTLTDIDLSHVEDIGEAAFQGCTGLSSVDLTSLINIGKQAFSGCTCIAGNISLPRIVAVPDNAFSGCSNITGVQFGNVLRTIGTAAFGGCPIATLTFAEGLESIGSLAFYNTKVTDITFPASIKRIDKEAFRGSSLESVKFSKGSGGFAIGVRAFAECGNLTNVTFAEGLETIENGAFSYDRKLASITLPEGLQSLGSQAFSGDGALKNVSLPSTLQTMGKGAFDGTPWAAAQKADDTGILYYGPFAISYTIGSPDAGTVIRIKDGTRGISEEFIHSHPENITGLVLPSSLKSIGARAFAGTAITSLNIPEGLDSIEAAAFSNCSSLTKLSIPESVKKLGIDGYRNGVFDGCSSITQVTLYTKSLTKDSQLGSLPGLAKLTVGSQVQVLPRSFFSTNGEVRVVFEDRPEDSELFIGSQALPYGNIKSLSLPNCRIALDDDAFNGFKLTFEIPGVITAVGNGALRGSGVTGTIRFSDEVKTIGQRAFYCCNGLTSITIPNSVTTIGYEAFYGCSGLTSVTIPNSVTSIEFGAFRVCSGLTSVTIPNSVTSIGGYAFYFCSGLTSVTIGNSVMSIGECAFYDCRNLTSVYISDIAAWCKISFEYSRYFYGYPSNPLSYAHHIYLGEEEIKDLVIPNSVTSIGDGAFYDCSGLTSVTIPNSVTTIGYEAFYDCRGLTSVTIGNSVTSIGNGAFNSCNSLTSVTIPNSVTSIGECAFQYCSRLTSVTIGNSVTSIGECAFRYCNSLSEVHSMIMQPFAIDDNVFQNYGNKSLYVPLGTKAEYQATDGWKNFTTIIETDFTDGPNGDVNGDNAVDVADIATVISVMAKGGTDLTADVNGDGVVDVADIATIISEMAARARQCEEAEH